MVSRLLFCTFNMLNETVLKINVNFHMLRRYVECTSACMQALASFQKRYPHHRTKEIAKSIQRARKYIESIQKDDGSW